MVGLLAKNSVALQDFVEKEANCWKMYQFQQEDGRYRFWWFNLCGRISYDAGSEEEICTTTTDIKFRKLHWNREYYCKGEHVV